MPRKPQRYKLTHEFVLREPSDYAFVRSRIEATLRHLAETTTGFAPDYLAIEKVDEK